LKKKFSNFEKEKKPVKKPSQKWVPAVLLEGNSHPTIFITTSFCLIGKLNYFQFRHWLLSDWIHFELFRAVNVL